MLESSAKEDSMDDSFTYRGMVYPWHCDHMGHMNVMHYVGKFDEACWNMFSRLGLTPSFLRRSGRGMAAVEQRIRYQRELVAGDVVAVQSVVTELRDKALIIEQTLFNAEHGYAAATMTLTGVHLDTHARKAVPFTPEIAARIRAFVARPPVAAAFQV
jgi:acyl-CoA thioester hydrolase